MAGGVVALGLFAAVVAASVAGTSAQSGCTTVIISLAPCLGFIQGNSTAPPSACCTQLASVVQSQPRCLCQVLNGGIAALGIAVNRTQALALPGACKVQTPPVSQCNVAAGPASSPTEAPAPASPSTPTPPSTSAPETPSSTPSTPASPSPAAGGGSKTTPSTGGQSSGGGSSNNMTPLSIVFCALFFLVSYASATGIL